MTEEQPAPASYNRAQFEHAFRSITQMVHAVGFLDIKEIQRWVMVVTDPAETKGAKLTEAQLEGRTRVLALLDNLNTFKETLKVTGVPPVPPMQVNPNQNPPTPNSEVPRAKPQ